MAERPDGVVEQRQLRLVVAIGLEQAGQMLRRVVGQLGGKRDLEQLAEVPAVEQARHIGSEAGDPELRLGPSPGGGEARERELALRVERVVEVEHQDEAAHAASLDLETRMAHGMEVPHREPEHGGRPRLVRKSERQRHLRQQSGDAERRLCQHGAGQRRRP